ncbi:MULTISPECIES: TonB-dependent receptor [Chryseobacterium]|uniref:TonB-dependent receptor n=1 Tax=Chryseobacterium TaxID=59732 RepID=UPI0013DE5E0F|nr:MULTISPECIES: TonB-dependent receptor [Chryseobacterium]MDG4654533.1 TonB-dependent receptor [Chryseobacterium arthrosphaerae]
MNIVSRKPIKALDIDGQSGVGFADGTGVNSYFTALNIGTRQDKFYIMGSASLLKVDNYLISRKFDRTQLQPSLERVNSESMDVRLSAKFGYTLNAKLSVNIVKEVNFDFGVRNLFDRNYYLSYGYPKEGRNFITAVNYHF